jgi:hypothetical protein
MKKSWINFCFTIIALVVTTGIGWSQTTGALTAVQYRNIRVAADGESFSMEIWAQAKEGYTAAAAPWADFTIRFDLDFVGPTMGPTATGIGTLGSDNITFGLATSGSVTSSPPGGGGFGPKLGINLTRGAGGNLTSAFQRLATINIPVTGGKITSASVASTRTTPEFTGSYWTSDGQPDTFRAIEVAPQTPLPVTLTSFRVSKEGGSVAQINWSTTLESNSSHFEVERSTNTKEWQTIGTKQASSNSSQLISYNFTDTAPASGINYYRLKMVDLDGSFANSNVESINFGEFTDNAITVFPNPVSDVLYLNDPDVASLKQVALVSADGVTAYQSNTITSEGISVRNLIDGLYIVKVTRADGSLTNHRVVITR